MQIRVGTSLWSCCMGRRPLKMDAGTWPAWGDLGDGIARLLESMKCIAALDGSMHLSLDLKRCAYLPRNNLDMACLRPGSMQDLYLKYQD